MMTNASAQIGTFGPHDHAEDAFAGIEKLRNLRDIKSLLKLLPYIRSQAIAITTSELVCSFKRVWASSEEIARRFANVDEEC